MAATASGAPHLMGWGSKYFVPTDSLTRVRRIADVLTAVTGLILAGIGIAGIDRLPRWETAFEDAVAAFPSWLLTIFDVGYLVGLVCAFAIVAVLIFGGPERRSALRDVLVSLVASLGMAYLLAWVYVGEWPLVFPAFAGSEPDPRFPVLRLVVVTAILIASFPHFAAPMRRLGWTLIITTGVSAATLGLGDPSDAIGSVGVAMLVAGAWLSIVGSPRGYPDPSSVSDALKGLGVTIGDIEIDSAQSWGTRRLLATTDAGIPLEIKAYGRDAADSARLAKVWRTLSYRESSRTVSYSRLQAVEHEALLTMLAGQAGVRVSTIVAAGQSSSEMALLALVREGETLAETEVDNMSDATIAPIWRDIAAMHDASISHGSLTTSAVRMTDDGHIITDFSAGSVVPNEADQALDVVEFLASLSAMIGAERAVSTNGERPPHESSHSWSRDRTHDHSRGNGWSNSRHEPRSPVASPPSGAGCRYSG